MKEVFSIKDIQNNELSIRLLKAENLVEIQRLKDVVIREVYEKWKDKVHTIFTDNNEYKFPKELWNAIKKYCEEDK